jgi:alkylhydroperoxidase/carboxymuconolactone decarboxylase family protein YurZ
MYYTDDSILLENMAPLIISMAPFTLNEIEFLSIAFDASYTHMYAPGTRRHIKGALKAGATMEEIMEVLKLCVVQGVQACNLGVPILAEEIAAASKAVARP